LRVEGLSPEKARVQSRYGHVFQAPALYPWRNVERNVRLPLEPMGLPKAEQKARTENSWMWCALRGLAIGADLAPRLVLLVRSETAI
jgi:NitT/TauT family transport system ATP-binding protein